MNKKWLGICCLCIAISCNTKSKTNTNTDKQEQMETGIKESTKRFNPQFATQQEARKLMLTNDHYTNSWNSFDIASRLQKTDGTKEELLQAAANEVMDWSAEEKEKITAIINSINDSISKQGFQLPFPKEIILVKTPMTTEGGAGGYTRSNWIALCDKMLEMPENNLATLISHELFHILTRNDREFKKEMYKAIGFTVMKDEIEFPSDLKEAIINNPDVSRNDSYATFTIKGEKKNCTMVLYTKKPYTTGFFFNYMNVGLVPLDDAWKPVQENGNTVIYPLEDVSDFQEQVGKNTGYIINPEEILADNFVIALFDQQNIPTPELKERIQSILKSYK